MHYRLNQFVKCYGRYKESHRSRLLLPILISYPSKGVLIDSFSKTKQNKTKSGVKMVNTPANTCLSTHSRISSLFFFAFVL